MHGNNSNNSKLLVYFLCLFVNSFFFSLRNFAPSVHTFESNVLPNDVTIMRRSQLRLSFEHYKLIRKFHENGGRQATTNHILVMSNHLMSVRQNHLLRTRTCTRKEISTKFDNDFPLKFSIENRRFQWFYPPGMIYIYFQFNNAKAI